MHPNRFIRCDVERALAEDIGSGDLSAVLIPASAQAKAQVVCRQNAVLCGCLWFEACFRKLDSKIRIRWHVREGERMRRHQIICTLGGRARAILSAERSALNFLQTLSATATRTRRFVEAIKDTRAVIMDTRKTLPGLRYAQKYAVKVGGGKNQRAGLFDGMLLKGNHILAAGGISEALHRAKNRVPKGVPLQVEVENLKELGEALKSGARLILLDNFSITNLRKAVSITAGKAKLEASGGITLKNVVQVAQTGVDRISIGSLTKDIEAIDLSLRFIA